jgi:predicted kinase
LLDIAFKCLKAGVDVILDDGFWSRARRDEMRDRVKKAGANFKLYYIKCSDKVMRQRTLKRTDDKLKDVFYIDEKALKIFKKGFEPLGEDEEHIVIKNCKE